MFTDLLSFIFIGIAFIHFYWAFGGSWARLKAVPTQEDGDLLFIPKFTACFLVGASFLVFVLLINYRFFYFIPKKISTLSLYIIMVLFFLRSVGDFRYIGIFKKITNTSFAKKDNLLYTPLCFIIIVLAILSVFF